MQPLPLMAGDTISFKLTISPEPNQHLLVSRQASIDDRTYKIQYVLQTPSNVTSNTIARNTLENDSHRFFVGQLGTTFPPMVTPTYSDPPTSLAIALDSSYYANAKLSWVKPSTVTNPITYNVRYASANDASNGNWNLINDIADVSINITNLVFDLSYIFNVNAKDSGRNSSSGWIDLSASSNVPILYKYNSPAGGTTFAAWEDSTSPSDESIIYVGTQNSGIYKYIYPDFSTATQISTHNSMSIACDATGNKIAILGSYNDRMYMTTNGGSIWTEVTNLPITPSGLRRVVMSSDGLKIMVATLSSNFFYSNNGGNTWMTKPGFQAYEFRSNNDMSCIYGTTINRMYKSTNEGSSWELLTTPIEGRFFDINMRGDGSKIAYVTDKISNGSNNELYFCMSTDYGQSWSPSKKIYTTTTNFAARNIKMSDDGTVIAIAINIDGILLSNDSGNNWNKYSVSNSLLSVYVSPSKKFIMTNAQTNLFHTYVLR
jgi:photosystem II stability/assembly factor-like uncharacterized protein